MATHDTTPPLGPAATTTQPNPNHEYDDVDDDPFNPVSTAQNLESSYYTEGYALGRSDGARAGRIEGRVFGLEKGYEKFFAMGRLGGRAAVWGARLHQHEGADHREEEEEEEANKAVVGVVAPLRQHPRLAGHVTTLHALAEAASLETRNTEDGVADFDDRLRRAEAKAKVIERVVVEPLGGDEMGVGEGEDENGQQEAEAEAETETEAQQKEDFAVEVTMGDVEVRLRKEREDQQQKQNETTPSSSKKPPPSRAPKRAGFKVASGGSRARAGGGGGEKNMEDFGIGEARALGRLL